MQLQGVAVGATFALGIVLSVAAWLGWRPPPLPERWLIRLRANWLMVLKAGGVALAVALLIRWPVAALTAAALTYLWPKLFGGARDGKAALVRLEAVATWTESLRDTIAAAIGLEQAILSSANNAPDAIRPQLQRLAGRLRSHVPLPQGLSTFAEDFDDASVDLVTAALVMNARLRGAGLVSTLTALAATARAELDVRTRIEETRRNLRRSAHTIIAVTLVFAGGLTLLARDYLAPYGSLAGQLALFIVVGLFGMGFWWIRSASQIDDAPRFLAGANQLSELNGATS